MLQEELGDLEAAICFVINKNDLDNDFIGNRIFEKIKAYTQWEKDRKEKEENIYAVVSR